MLKYILIYAAKNCHLQAPTATSPVKEPPSLLGTLSNALREKVIWGGGTHNAPSEKRALFPLELRPTCRAVTVYNAGTFMGVLRMSQIREFSLCHGSCYLWNTEAKQSLLYRIVCAGESAV
jgi:hypothetical protein